MTILAIIGAAIVLATIKSLFGLAASMWFAGGFLVAALLCFLEAGVRKRAGKAGDA